MAGSTVKKKQFPVLINFVNLSELLRYYSVGTTVLMLKLSPCFHSHSCSVCMHSFQTGAFPVVSTILSCVGMWASLPKVALCGNSPASPWGKGTRTLGTMDTVGGVHGMVGTDSLNHYCDVIMSSMASHIPGVTTVCSTVCSGADEGEHQSSASLTYVRGIYRWPWNSLHKGPVTIQTYYTT